MKFSSLIDNRWLIVDAKFCQNQMLFVKVSREVYTCNDILVTEIICYRYSTIIITPLKIIF